jgi:hypothetical protein
VASSDEKTSSIVRLLQKKFQTQNAGNLPKKQKVAGKTTPELKRFC